MMKTLKIATLGIVAAVAMAAVMAAAPAKAQSFGSTNDLSSLIVSNGLFTGYSAGDLAGLIATDAITSGGSMSGGTNNLNDLIVMSGLFGGWGYNAVDLAGLIAVDNMY